jgi:integrase
MLIGRDAGSARMASTCITIRRKRSNSDQAAVPVERFAVVLERYVQEEIPKVFLDRAFIPFLHQQSHSAQVGRIFTDRGKTVGRAQLAQRNQRQKRQAATGHHNHMSLVRIEGSSKRRRKPRILTPQEFSTLIVAVDREPCRTMVILALCTGVRCSELVALKWGSVLI